MLKDIDIDNFDLWVFKHQMFTFQMAEKKSYKNFNNELIYPKASVPSHMALPLGLQEMYMVSCRCSK